VVVMAVIGRLPYSADTAWKISSGMSKLA
jgi:hypothetical protein